MQCPYNNCNGTGFKIQKDSNGEDEVVPCKCRNDKMQKDSLKRKLIDAKIPTRYWEYTFDNYLSLSKFFHPDAQKFNKSNVELLSNFHAHPELMLDRESEKQVFWIWGKDSNSCHTTLAIILGTDLLQIGKRVCYLQFYKLLEVFTDFEAKHDTLKSLKNYDVYIIDDAFDMTRCAITNYKQGQLFGFLNDILNDNKFIICTSNIPTTEIDRGFSQLQIILTRSCKNIELRGSLDQHLKNF